jgi:myosin heavy subunit
MLKNWFLITATSFGVGFGVTYLFTQSPQPSVIAGAAGTTGAIGSIVLGAKQRKQEIERQAQSLRMTVDILEQQEKNLGQQLHSHQDNRQTIQYQVEQLEQQLVGLQSKQQGQVASIAKFDRELETKRNSVIELDTKRVELNNITAEIANFQQQQATAQAALLELQSIEAEITIYSGTKAQLVLAVSRLEAYQTEIKIQIADDKDTCEKAEEYLQCVDQEVNDKQADLLELDINIKSKVSELNTCRKQLTELSQQKNEAELAIKELAVELQKAGEAILNQENIQQVAEVESAQLASDIASLKLELLDRHSQMTDASLQYVDVLPAALISASVLPMLIESPQPAAALPEPEAASLQLVDLQLAASQLEVEEISLDFMDYLDLMDSSPNLVESSLQFADYLPAMESELFCESGAANLELAETAGLELNELNSQFVEFQPSTISMADLEETSPVSASSFDELCEMDLIDIGTDILEFGLLDLGDLEDMTLDQDSLIEA